MCFFQSGPYVRGSFASLLSHDLFAGIYWVFDKMGICRLNRRQSHFGWGLSDLVKREDERYGLKKTLLCFTSCGLTVCLSHFIFSPHSLFSLSVSLQTLWPTFSVLWKIVSGEGWMKVVGGGRRGRRGALGRGSEWRLAPLSSCPDLHHVWLSLPVSIFSSLLFLCCEITHRHKFLHLE